MRVSRLHTQPGRDPIAESRYRPHKGEDWFEYTVPQGWGSAAVDVLLGKVFYRDPLPALTRAVPEDGVPEWLWRHAPDEAGLETISAEWRYRQERDARDVFHRISGGLAYHGWKAGLFDAEEDARAFYDEFRYLLLHRRAAPEIALLACAGLDWAYGLQGKGFEPAAQIAAFGGAVPKAPHAGVTIPPGLDQKNLLRRIRLTAETLSLDDDGRRISVLLPVENVDSRDFATLRRRGDIEVLAREAGTRMLIQALHLVMDACDREAVFGFDPDFNPELAHAMDRGRRAGIGEAALRAALSYAQQGFENIGLRTAPEAEEAPLPLTPALSIPDEFIERALTGHGFMLEEGGEERRHVAAETLWNDIVEAIWSSGDPGLFFRDSAASFISGAGQSGQGGLIFAPGSAAPGATLNLPAFAGKDHIVDAPAVSHAATIMAVALEISFAYMNAPENTRAFRPLAIGFTGLSGLLMGNALAYDSDAGRNAAALVTALVSGAAHRASAELAASLGAFERYPACEKAFLQGVKDKMSAVSGTAYMQQGVTRRPVQLNAKQCADQQLVEAVGTAWEEAYAKGREKGFRHAHLTSVETDFALQALFGGASRDIAPEAGLARFEGYFTDALETSEMYGKKLNPVVPKALAKLGYGAAELDGIYFYAIGHGTLLDAPHINHRALKAKGFHQAALDALETALKSAQHIRYAFNKWTLGEDFCRRMLGFKPEELASGTFDMLTALGFSEDHIDAANVYCCGTMMLEGAPHLKPAHLCVFDCRAPAPGGVRQVSAEAQVKMQAALEPFLSGAAVNTIEVPHHATIEEVDRLALLGWELGAKQIRIYRDGCSLLHPIATGVQTAPEEVADVKTRALPPLLAKLAS